MLKIYIFVCIAAVCFASCSRVAELHVAADDKYNLCFRYGDSVPFAWTSYYSVHAIRVDSGSRLSRKPALALQQVKPQSPVPGLSEEQYTSPLLFYYYQTIVLPDSHSGKIQVRLNSKTRHVKDAYLRIAFSDRSEQILRKDSVLICSKRWKTNTLSADVPNARLVNIAIYNSSIARKVGQEVWLDRMEILVDGKDINSFPEPNIYAANSHIAIDKAQVQPISEVAPIALSGIASKKIVALGESVHGSKSVSSLCLRVMKSLVESDSSFRLILLELPIDECLLWNAYVLGQAPDSAIKDIAENLSRSLLPVAEVTDFFAWLRDYNSKRAAKVRLAGFDDSNMDMRLIPLFDYLYAVCYKPELKKEILPILDSLCHISTQISYAKVAELTATSSLRAALGEKDYEMLQYVLQRYVDIVPTLDDNNLQPQSAILRRDYTMFQHAKKAMSLYLKEEEKAALLAHYEHISKNNASSFPPFMASLGSYLSGHYGSSYFPVGVFAGEGAVSILSEKSWDIVAFPLSANPANSIEQVCTNVGISSFYAPISALPDEPLLTRYVRSRKAEQQFTYSYLQNRIDGFIFIKNSESGEEKDFIDVHVRLMLKRDRRRTQLMDAMKNTKR